MTEIDLQLDFHREENSEEVHRENFVELSEKWKENVFTQSEGKFIEHTFTSDDVGANVKLSHGLGFIPKDVITFSMTDDKLPDQGQLVYMKAKYNHNNTHAAAAWEVVEYDDLVDESPIESGYGFDGTNYRYKSRYDGRYEINIKATFSSSTHFDSGDYIRLAVYKNAAIEWDISDYWENVIAASTGARNCQFGGSTSVQLVKDDLVDIRIYTTNNSKTTSSYDERSHFEITRKEEVPVVFNKTLFDSTYLNLNVVYPCTVRFWVGSYLEARS